MEPTEDVVEVQNEYLSLAKNMLDNVEPLEGCLLYTSDAADERSSVDLGGRRIIKKKREKSFFSKII